MPPSSQCLNWFRCMLKWCDGRKRVIHWKKTCHSSPRGHIIFSFPIGWYCEKGCFQNPQCPLDRCHPPPSPFHPCDWPDFHKPYNFLEVIVSSHLKDGGSTFLWNGTFNHCIVWKPKRQPFSWRKSKLIMCTWKKLFVCAMGMWK